MTDVNAAAVGVRLTAENVIFYSSKFVFLLCYDGYMIYMVSRMF